VALAVAVAVTKGAVYRALLFLILPILIPFFLNQNLLKSFLDEAFGFIGYAGLNPAYKIKIKVKR
jgi:hypothetical protein